jgi:hypothetical protein
MRQFLNLYSGCPKWLEYDCHRADRFADSSRVQHANLLPHDGRAYYEMDSQITKRIVTYLNGLEACQFTFSSGDEIPVPGSQQTLSPMVKRPARRRPGAFARAIACCMMLFQ